MSWGEPSGQTPYDPNNPYAQQPYPQQPAPQQQPQPPQQQQNPGWGQQSGYTQPMPDPSGYGQGQPQHQPPYPYDAQSGGYQQPGYQQSGYQQPGYQQPGYGQPVYGQPDYPVYAPPPKKSNTGLILTVVAAVVVAGGGITAAVVLTGNSNSSNVQPVAEGSVSASARASVRASSGASAASSSPLSIPKSVSGLKLLDNSSAKSTVASMRSSLAEDPELYPDPVIAAYNDDGDTNVTELFEAQAISELDSAGQHDLAGYDPSSFVSELMTGSEIDNAEDEDTTADDGALSCGSRKIDDTDVVFCFWDDDTSFGGLEVFDSNALDDAAVAADAIRAAAEGS